MPPARVYLAPGFFGFERLAGLEYFRHVEGADELLRAQLGELPPREANDGIVPLRSQLWGAPVWVGKADHLDVVGYFRGRGGHRDWLCSGARFDRRRFDQMMDRIVEGMLEGP